MTLLMVYLAMLCGSAAAVCPGSPAGTMFRLMPLDDVMFTEALLMKTSAWTATDCSRKCMDTEGCVMFTFRQSQDPLSDRCRLHGQFLTDADDKEITPGARSYEMGAEAFSCLSSGYAMQCGRCIHFISETLTYLTAKQRCQELDGGRLFFAKTLDDITFGKTLLGNHDVKFIWVGADDREKEGTFWWTDGTSLPNNSSLWNPGEPNNHRGDEDCVTLATGWGKLNDMPCDVTFTYVVCQKDV